MLTSPISITIDGVAHSLSRLNQDNFTSVWFKRITTPAARELKLTVRHSYEGKEGAGQMERHNVDLLDTSWDVDGKPVIKQTYHVIRHPRNVDPDGVADNTVGLNAWLATNIAAITGWES